MSNLLIIIGYIIGLGAVTVIDLHGLLAQASGYWTQATISAHKITKPLIWVGIAFVILGNLLSSPNFNTLGIVYWILLLSLILNGMFLTFTVSPMLLQKEKEGNGNQILSQKWQKLIFISFIFSAMGWWGSLLIFVFFLF